ncbi:DUF4124 domain-containing protein [Massilia sp. S19_KUP03_FR1]|uniref:DUF4124 domain-containing protein n=1 Tax=Massilia sp. S19_KUP03_FR1 TaxID=3025503 RepID=UPI002FCD812B
MNKLLPAIAACAVLASASAQTMHKCMVDGKPSYGDRPCTSGVASELAIAPTPAADPETAARLARQHALAQQLTLRDVLADAAERQEQQRARRAAAGQKIKCDRLRLRQQWAREDVRSASKNTSAAFERKARRQAQAMALECPS